MKYFVLIPDGMADEHIPALGGLTPMEAADKPTMDFLASSSEMGMVQNVPAGMVPESDTANMAIMSFDPKVYSKGRSPLEAVSMGINMDECDVAIRCNTVTLSNADPKAPISEVVEMLRKGTVTLPSRSTRHIELKLPTQNWSLRGS